SPRRSSSSAATWRAAAAPAAGGLVSTASGEPPMTACRVAGIALAFAGLLGCNSSSGNGAAGATCTPDPALIAQARECRADDQCPCGAHCALGRCSADCSSASDCAAGQRCDQFGRCRASSDTGTVAPVSAAADG